jgi:hypothetical protein
MGHDWAGYTFHELGRHDGRFIKTPGIYAFVARLGGERTLLFAGETECIASAVDATHPQWDAASGLKMKELHVFLQARDRIEGLLVLDRIVRRCTPLLNLLNGELPNGNLAGSGRRCRRANMAAGALAPRAATQRSPTCLRVCALAL